MWKWIEVIVPIEPPTIAVSNEGSPASTKNEMLAAKDKVTNIDTIPEASIRPWAIFRDWKHFTKASPKLEHKLQINNTHSGISGSPRKSVTFIELVTLAHPSRQAAVAHGQMADIGNGVAYLVFGGIDYDIIDNYHTKVFQLTGVNQFGRFMHSVLDYSLAR